MKGIVFTEFLDQTDENFSPLVTETIIAACPLASGGAYTSLGRYNPAEFRALVDALAATTGRDAETIYRDFGRHLLGEFAVRMPNHFSTGNFFTFLKQLETRVHPDVTRLYPDAQVPSLAVRQISEMSVILTYSSPRRLASLASGLIEGAAEYFETPIAITRDDLPDDGERQCVRFTITLTRPRPTSSPVHSSSSA